MAVLCNKNDYLLAKIGISLATLNNLSKKRLNFLKIKWRLTACSFLPLFCLRATKGNGDLLYPCFGDPYKEIA